MIDHVDIPPGNPALARTGRGEGGTGQGQGQGHAPPKNPTLLATCQWNPSFLSPSPARAEPCACTCGLANRCDRQDDVTYKRTARPLFVDGVISNLAPLVSSWSNTVNTFGVCVPTSHRRTESQSTLHHHPPPSLSPGPGTFCLHWDLRPAARTEYPHLQGATGDQQ